MGRFRVQKTIHALGITALIITSLATSFAEQPRGATKAQKLDARQCMACHSFPSERPAGVARRKALPLDALSASRLKAILAQHPGFDWRKYSAWELEGLAAQLKHWHAQSQKQ